MFDLIIIGAGPAGLTSAIYALRSGLEVLLIEREIYGGKMNLTNEITNYPGHTKIAGIELSKQMFESVKSLGIKIEYDQVIRTRLNDDIKFVCTEQEEFSAVSVIIANGLKTKHLGCIGEKEFFGKGVSYCAICDGFFFKNKNVIIAGGGNTALEDAIYLSNICKKVNIIVRKNCFRAEEFLVDLIKSTENICVFFETEILEIKGDNKVNSVILENNCVQKEVEIDAVFIAIGQQPENEAFSEIKMDRFGYFDSDETCTTNIEGVFVAGDCRVKFLRQIVTATSDGATAASLAIKYLKKHKFVHSGTSVGVE
ncbi:MAG: FAD-dependent oxidoreductase [Oscillospiraceae bacterium]|nr:FAD-dependent oxidoreductase [Oscillospiraceae bacterium]